MKQVFQVLVLLTWPLISLAIELMLEIHLKGRLILHEVHQLEMKFRERYGGRLPVLLIHLHRLRVLLGVHIYILHH